MRSQTLSISHSRLRTKKRIDDSEGVNRRDGSGRKTVVELAGYYARDFFEWHPAKMASTNSLSITACTSVDTFVIVHATVV